MKSFGKTALATCLVLAGSLSGFCTGPNLINDGGFETPVTGPGGLNSGYTLFVTGNTIDSAWSVIGPSGGSFNVAVVPSTEYTTGSAGNIYFLAQEGSQSLDLSGNFDTGAAMGVQQTFATVAGHSYSLNFYAGAVTTPHWVGHNGSAIINVQLNGSPLLAAVNSDPPSGDFVSYKQFNVSFTATGSSTTLSFIGGTAAGIGHNGLDNVSVVEVPEPGTCGLLALGIASWCVVRQKKLPKS